jgi:hypothetical protein
MWPDNETDRDFLNFTGVVESAISGLAQIWNLSEGSATQVMQDTFRNLCLESPGS